MNTEEKKGLSLKSFRKKRPFTLLEICICLAILGIISGFLGWKILDAVSHHRFESSASEVASEMKRLEGLALSYQGEFGIRIFQKDEQFFYVLFTDEPLNFFPRFSPRPLKGISSLTLNHKPAQEASFVMLPSGKIEPQAVMGLHHGEKGKWLDFRKALQIKVQNSYPQSER
jgi:prepilin-type N-terminal cleavage/methylation domain-containing protein